MDQFSKVRSPELSPMGRLSERQKQCLELVAVGYTSKQIGRQLNLSPSTVDNHLNAALERLGVDSRAVAARIFMEGNQNTGFSPQSGGLIDSRLPNADHGVRFDDQASTASNDILSSLLRVPPLGGRENKLSRRRRYYHVVQIMILALMAFSAVTVTIAGVVHLFSG